jgi:hypothetical protein
MKAINDMEIASQFAYNNMVALARRKNIAGI